MVYSDQAQDYEPQFIDAAQAELARRGVSGNDSHFVSEVLENVDARDKERAQARLGCASRIAFALFSGFLIIVAAVAIYFAQSGQTRKASDAWASIAAGWLFWLCLAVAAATLS